MKNDTSADQPAELTPEQSQLARKMEGLMDKMG